MRRSLLAFACLLLVACGQVKPWNSPIKNPLSDQTRLAKTYVIPSVVNESIQPLWKWDTKAVSGRESLTKIQFVSATQGWVASNEGTLYTTTDAGETWRPVILELQPDAYITNIFFANSSIGWVCDEKLGTDTSDSGDSESWLMHTSDGGQSWNLQYAAKDAQISRVVFINDQEGWLAGTRFVKRKTLQNDLFVLHTTSQGSRWTDVSGSLNQKVGNDIVNDIYAIEPSKSTLLTIEGNIYSTTNGGQSWDQVEAIKDELPQTAMLRVGKLESNHLWALGGAASLEGTWSILAQKVSGNSWTGYRTGGIYLSDAVFLSANRVLACGFVLNTGNTKSSSTKRAAVILYSSDGGSNWSIIYRDARSKSINALAAIDSSHIWAVGEDGLILRLESPSLNVSSR